MKKLLFAPLLAPVAVLALAIPASASTIGGQWSITPGSGSAETTHFVANGDTGKWNYAAAEVCTDGIELVGGWKTWGSGDTSNTASCSATGNGNADSSGFVYRQSSPLFVTCWTGGGGRGPKNCTNLVKLPPKQT